MKTFFTFAITLLLLTSCKVTKVYQSPFKDFQPKLAHVYNGTSTENPNSQFRALNRTIEFEYNITERDSIVEVLMMLTSGFNEGEVTDHLLVNLQNEETLRILYNSKNSREYVESYSHNYTQPVTNTQTVTDPGGIDLVTKSDGTVEHVHRPMTTKTVNTTEQVAHTRHGNKSQIFNSGKFQFQKEDIEKIKLHGVNSFEIILQNSNLILELSNQQTYEMKSYLAQ